MNVVFLLFHFLGLFMSISSDFRWVFVEIGELHCEYCFVRLFTLNVVSWRLRFIDLQLDQLLLW